MMPRAAAFLDQYGENMHQVEAKLFEAYKTLLKAAADMGYRAQGARSLKTICDTIEHAPRAAAGKACKALEDMPRRTLEELGAAGGGAAARAALAYLVLSKIAYIAYLATGDMELLSIGTLFYATGKTLEDADTEKPLYLLAALTLLAGNRETDALALAAYAARENLPLQYPRSPGKTPRNGQHSFSSPTPTR